jgi:hypothetical protein
VGEVRMQRGRKKWARVEKRKKEKAEQQTQWKRIYPSSYR